MGCPSGEVDYCWPNNASVNYAGPENGAIVSHIAYVVECILETPELWSVTIPDGDPNDLGETYYERALTYANMCDEVLVDFILKRFLNEENLIIFPADWNVNDNRLGKNPPWNQQWMMSGGFIHMARVHDLLGSDGNPTYAARYRTVIQTLLDHFLSQLVLTETADGHEVYEWGYWPIYGNQTKWGKYEDANDAHAAYDIQGVYYCYIYGYNNITEEILQRFANTMKYVIYDPNDANEKWYAGSVNGLVGEGRRNYVWPQWYFVGAIDTDCYNIFAQTLGGVTNNSLERMGHNMFVRATVWGVEK